MMLPDPLRVAKKTLVNATSYLDGRRAARRILAPIQRSVPAAVLNSAICFGLAALIAFVPEYSGLEPIGRRALFVLVSAAALWIFEAIPTFAVGLVIIALNVALLGDPAQRHPQAASLEWTQFVAPWGSPLLWLFFGGFIIAAAASKTGLDRWFAQKVLALFGSRPQGLLAGVMAITFVTSMFMSNTATAAMMLAMLAPVIQRLRDDPFSKALVLGTAFSANIGGMATLIGTPPNAIAAGAMARIHPITFAEWMGFGLPPALILAVLTWAMLYTRYRPAHTEIRIAELIDEAEIDDHGIKPWQRMLTLVVIVLTVGIWLTSSVHGIPTTVAAIMPIAVFTAFGILDEHDIRGLSWDVLLLLAGGLSLGIAVTETGIADWLVQRFAPQSWGTLPLAGLMAYTAGLLSNIMSNTAAANILIPIGAAMAPESIAQLVIPIALAASSAMAMPVSTPPNAIAYSTGQITTRDLFTNGALLGLIAPGVALGWVWVLSLF